jgi:hypothetical protein
MPKKKGKPEDQTGKSDVLDAFFDQITDAFRAEEVPSKSARVLACLKPTLVSSEVTKMTAKDFTLKEAADAFGLLFNKELSKVPMIAQSQKWRIEHIPETK